MPAFKQEDFVPADLALPYDSMLTDVIETKAKGLRKIPVVENLKQKVSATSSPRENTQTPNSFSSMASSSCLKVAFSTPPPPRAFQAIPESVSVPGFADVRKVPSRFL